MEREPIDWQPRDNRRRVSITGVAVREDGSSHRVAVTNISYRGCHLFCQEHLSVGEVFRLTVTGSGPVDAQVRWSNDQSVGVRFLLSASVAEDRRARLGI